MKCFQLDIIGVSPSGKETNLCFKADDKKKIKSSLSHVRVFNSTPNNK